MSTNLLLSILLEPLSAILRGFWVDAGQPSPDEPWYATLVSIYTGFVKVPVLWRLHMVLRFVKFLCIVETLSVPKPHTAAAISKWYAGNVLQAIHSLLFLLDWIPGRIFRKEIFRPKSGDRIKQLWLIYLFATSFQIFSTVALAAIIPRYWFGIIQCLVTVFNLYYCFGMNRLRPQFEYLRARIETVDAPYEPTIDRSRSEIGGSIPLNNINADIPNGPLAKAFRDQQRQLRGSGSPGEQSHDPGIGPSQLSISPSKVDNEESHENIPTQEELRDALNEAPNCLNFANRLDASEQADNLIFPSRISSTKWTDASVWITYWLLALLSILVIILDAIGASKSAGLNTGLIGMFFIISFLSLGFQLFALSLTRHRIDLESPVPNIPLTLSWRQLAGAVIGFVLILQASLFLAILISLFNHKFAKSIIHTNHIIPLLAVLFDVLACLAGVALFIVTRFDLL